MRASEVRDVFASAALRPDHVLPDASQQLPQAFNAQVLPTTLFFDAQGALRSIHVGALSQAMLAAGLRHITPKAAVVPARRSVPP